MSPEIINAVEKELDQEQADYEKGLAAAKAIDAFLGAVSRFLLNRATDEDRQAIERFSKL